MNETKKTLRQMTLLFFLTTIFFALVAIVLRTVNLLYFFDVDLGYYTTGALLPILEWVILGSSVAILLTGAIVLFRGKPIAYDKNTRLGVRIGAVVAALGFAYLLLTELSPILIPEEEMEATASINLLPLLFGLGAIAYFVLVALNVKNEVARLVSGFCVILRLLYVLTASYFDFLVPMNAPDKLMLQLGILSAMLFLVNELRATVAEPRSVLYMFFAGCATVLLGASSLPSLIASRQEILRGDSYGRAYLVLCGLFFYVALRFLFLCLSPEPTENLTSSVSEESAESSDAPCTDAEETTEQ